MTDDGTPPAKRPGAGLGRILVATDLTASADRALDRVAMLARDSGAAVRLLHVIDSHLLPDAHVREKQREAERQLELDVSEVGFDTSLEVSVKVASGDADKAVVAEAAEMRADLIVLGLSRDASLRGVLRGTMIDLVVRRAHCPVLVVKTRARRPYASVAVAVDLAEPSRRALDLALHLFGTARFTILHADERVPATHSKGTKQAPATTERQHQIEDMIVARFAAAGAAGPGKPGGPDLLVAGGRAVTVLQEQVAQAAPDLVVLGTHGRSGASNLFLGSVAETLLEILPCDVLVTRR